MVWAVFEAFLNGILPHLLQGRPNRRSRNWAKSTKQVADLFSRETCGSVQNIGGPEVTCCIPVPRPMEDLVVLAVQLAHRQGGGGGDEAHHDPLLFLFFSLAGLFYGCGGAKRVNNTSMTSSTSPW